MHSSTSARSHSSRARSSAAAGSSSPNSTTSGFSGRRSRSAARRRASAASARRVSLERVRCAPQSQARAAARSLPCTSTSSRVPALRCSMSMFCVITASSSPRALQLDERAVGAVGLLALERREALAVEAPEAHGVGAEGVDVRDLHRVDVLPQPRARRAEVGDARRHRDARAGQRDDRAGASRRGPAQRAPAGCASRRRRTRHCALSEAAACVCRGRRRCPPCASALAKTAREAPPSRPRCPRRGRRCAETCLICSTRERRLLGEPARPGQRGVEQFVVLDHAVDEPELERLLGDDRIADEVHLERLVRADQPRQPLRAAEAGDDPELDLRLAEQRRARRDAHVAGHRELAAAAEGEAVDGGDRRDARRCRARGTARAPPSISSRAGGLVHRRERLDVGAGARTASGWTRRSPARARRPP